MNILKTLNAAQLRLIDEINALATKAAKLTGEERVEIVHLIKTLVSSSSFPLNSESAWFRGYGEGCLSITRRAYDKYKKEYDEMKVRHRVSVSALINGKGIPCDSPPPCDSLTGEIDE